MGLLALILSAPASAGALAGTSCLTPTPSSGDPGSEGAPGAAHAGPTEELYGRLTGDVLALINALARLESPDGAASKLLASLGDEYRPLAGQTRPLEKVLTLLVRTPTPVSYPTTFVPLKEPLAPDAWRAGWHEIEALFGREAARARALDSSGAVASRERDHAIVSACLTAAVALHVAGDTRSNDAALAGFQTAGGALRAANAVLGSARSAHTWLPDAIGLLDDGADPLTATRQAAGVAAGRVARATVVLDEDDWHVAAHRAKALTWTAQSEGVAPSWRGRAALVADDLVTTMRARGEPPPTARILTDPLARLTLLSFAVGESKDCHPGNTDLPDEQWDPRPSGTNAEGSVIRDGFDGRALRPGGDRASAEEAAARLVSWSATLDGSGLHRLDGPLGALLDGRNDPRALAVLCDVSRRMDVEQSVEAALASGERAFFAGDYAGAVGHGYAAIAAAATLGDRRPRTGWWVPQFGEITAAYINSDVDPARPPVQGVDASRLQAWARETGSAWYLGLAGSPLISEIGPTTPWSAPVGPRMPAPEGGLVVAPALTWLHLDGEHHVGPSVGLLAPVGALGRFELLVGVVHDHLWSEHTYSYSATLRIPYLLREQLTGRLRTSFGPLDLELRAGVGVVPPLNAAFVQGGVAAGLPIVPRLQLGAGLDAAAHWWGSATTSPPSFLPSIYTSLEL